MNKRDFFKTLIGGAVVAPVVVKASAPSQGLIGSGNISVTVKEPLAIPMVTLNERKAMRDVKPGTMVFQTDDRKGLKTFCKTGWMATEYALDDNGWASHVPCDEIV
ncbi:hypothetical protein MUK70_11940 [Dyadobacter chenwenxiniae]|uniref:Uncharacterized protein n=1 Tax=Dyadobacter chenwenxiniae TaxID=2906456 RepID=A0A9X1TJF0_9BACT|nr:hypothetical protein [Dyadobacter chenwenxiniae]MCF0059953.1 hypothetical protein [Dyadobacter chenwenxiniae]UON85692.1 hypothetical protein MUK70_11940 [Dyadobacter chenwenxiniae]